MVDLHVHSCFSFLDGASHPEELVARAVELGYTALALTDHDGLYGSMEFAQHAKEAGLQAITGAEVTLEDEAHLTLLAETPRGYANLCRLLTLAHRHGERRFPRLPYAALPEHAEGLIALSGCRRGEVPRLLEEGHNLAAERAAIRYREWFGPEGFFLEMQQNLVRGDTARLRALAELGRKLGIPLAATNNTHYHVRERHRLQDTMVAIRQGLSLDEAHRFRRANSEFALKHPETLRARFREYPEALENAFAIAARCRAFDITKDLGYVFPEFADEAVSPQRHRDTERIQVLHHGDTESTERLQNAKCKMQNAKGISHAERSEASPPVSTHVYPTAGSVNDRRPFTPFRVTAALAGGFESTSQFAICNSQFAICNSTRNADLVLRTLCEQALAVKYAADPPARQEEAKRWLEEELRLTKLHGLAGFFLVYRDLLQLSKLVAAELRGTGARGRFEMPPGRGRGSAVSSIICYLIGLSPVDPVRAKLFPGRFLNESLTTVPDIDLDFPRDIRAELIERVHDRYGRDHVALVCMFPTYRFRGAVREIGKALALPPAELDRLAKLGDAYGHVGDEMDRLGEFSRYGDNRLWQHLRELSDQLRGMPRHLSQHVGGIIISSRPLVEIVPLENSAMEGRQVCQWDKDSCDAARMIKIDFLALGMLSAVEECLELIAANDKPPVDLSRIEFTDRRVYNRICRAETVGAFQIESRAQIGMLVRTLPRNMEDLAVQVAIVRPGPIVGNAVNPYVRQRELMRRDRSYRPQMDHPLLEPVLADTLGVIIYQDQVMEVCKHLAGFTDGQADQLRRAMSRKRSRANMEKFRDLFMQGAAGRGVPEETAGSVFEKVVAFSEFGFPKSHAAAFAVLAYQSMWLLCYHPAEFVASVLNNQPMGFYGRDTLVKDAQRHGVRFLQPDLNESALGCTVQRRTVRLGLKFVEGVGEVKGKAILAERERNGPFASLPDFLRRTRQSDRVAEALILVGAMDRFGLNRRELVWQLGLVGFQRGEGKLTIDNCRFAIINCLQPALDLPTDQDQVSLRAAGRWEKMAHDYRLLELSVDGHPMQHLRPLLHSTAVPIGRLRQCRDGSRVRIAGLVTTRQRPETAKGILFLLVEDESGMVNVVVRKELHEAGRELYRGEPLLVIEGILEQKARRLNLVAETAWSLRDELPDAVKSPGGRRVQQAVDDWQAPRPHQFR